MSRGGTCHTTSIHVKNIADRFILTQTVISCTVDTFKWQQEVEQQIPSEVPKTADPLISTGHFTAEISLVY